MCSVCPGDSISDFFFFCRQPYSWRHKVDRVEFFWKINPLIFRTEEPIWQSNELSVIIYRYQSRDQSPLITWWLRDQLYMAIAHCGSRPTGVPGPVYPGGVHRTREKRQCLGWHLPADTSLFGVDVDLYGDWMKFASCIYIRRLNMAVDQVTVQPGSAGSCCIAIHHM